MQKLSFFIFLSLGYAQAQTLSVSNVKATQAGGIGNITYDLQAPAGKTHYVGLYYSTDGGSSFSDELVYVNGDVKSNVVAGIGKKISWNSNKELGSLSGNVVFKVVAEGKAKMPPPGETNMVKVEVLSVERSGGTVSVTISVNPKQDFGCYFTPTNCYFIDEKGNKLMGQGDQKFKQLVSGIPVKFIYTFSGAEDSKSISLLSINAGDSFQFRNIVLPNN